MLKKSGSRKKRRLPVAARAGGDGAIEKQAGRKARCRALGSRRGGCRPRGSGGVGTIRQVDGACCNLPCLGTHREQGTRCPRPEEPSPSARGRRSVGPTTKDGHYHRMAPRVRASQLVEDQLAVCLGIGPDFFSSLVSVTSLLILQSPFLSPRLFLHPGTPRPP